MVLGHRPLRTRWPCSAPCRRPRRNWVLLRGRLVVWGVCNRVEQQDRPASATRLHPLSSDDGGVLWLTEHELICS